MTHQSSHYHKASQLKALPADAESQRDIPQQFATTAAVVYWLTGQRAEDDADALADGQEAGDLDAEGNAIPYPKYRSA